MAFNKRTWLGRQGTGLNKFSINGATPVTVVNQPDSITEQGDALSAGNLNDLENRIAEAFEDTASASDVQTLQQETTALRQKANSLQKQIDNITEAEDLIETVDYANGENAVPANVSKYAEVGVLKGVGRVENNLNDDGDFYGVGYTTVTDTDYNHGCKATVASGRAYSQINKVFNLYAGRTYLLIFDIATNDSFGTGTQIVVNSATVQRNYFTPVKGRNYVLWTQALDCSSWVQFQIYFADENGHDIEITNVCLCDLNIYFNTSDLSFLGANDSAKLATIQQNYPELLEPSDYGTSVVFPTYTAVKSKGRNLWDEQIEVGTINATTGQNESNPNILRSTNYIPIRPNDAFFFCSPINGIWFYYDIGKNYLGSVSVGSNALLTAPSGAFYFRFRLSSDYGIVYKNNICVNQSDSQNGTYTPYMEDTLTLPSPVTLKGAGDVAEMYYPETGRVTHPLGEVTITSSNLGDPTDNGNRAVFGVTLSSSIGYADASDVPDILMAGFVPATQNATWVSGMVSASTANTNVLYVIMPTGTTKADMLSLHGGDTITYELATPSADSYVDPIPDPFIQVEGGGTIKPVQTNEPEIDSAMTVTYVNKITA